jgi:single-stranded-DNA-specific exonuclease
MEPVSVIADGATRVCPKVWQLLPHDAAAIEGLSRLLRVSPIVAHLLINRKITDQRAAEDFLVCPMNGLHAPELLPGVPEACDRIVAAIAANKKICIYGDYDVDGVTGTAILQTCLKHIGAQAVDFHVPHRLNDGYGLNSESLKKLAEQGFQLIITVDCGIASIAEADYARELGVELIITDHHEPKATYPRADVLVHPRLPVGSNGQTRHYPFAGLSGAGVAFKLAWALAKRHCGGPRVTTQLREFLLDAIVLAAMGTVADVVPLFGENRIFVRHGLARMRSHPSHGLKSLLRFCKLDNKKSLAAMDIGFSLAPRINAAGRLGTARLAVELLTTLSAERADVLADYLERQNHERQLLERRIMTEARAMAAAYESCPALILASDAWHPGLLGIVASRLVDQMARPVLMIALRDGQHGQGSGRSIPGFKLHEALQECTDDLVSHGGHAIAAGFRILPELIPAFRDRFAALAQRHFGDRTPAHRLVIDAEVPLSSLTTNLLLTVEQMEPFGAANPAPLLLADRVQIVGEPRKVGVGERHLSFRVRQNGKDIRCIAFGMADRMEEMMSQSGQCCIAFTPRLNEWQGYRNIEIEVRDFQPGPTAKLE